MISTISLLLVFLNRFFMPRHNAQLRLLKAQVAILRTRVPTQRIILSPAEKAELLRIGEECGHEIDGLMEVAKPATYKRWLAQMRGGRPFQAVGRPRLTQELRDVVICIGSENLLWGYKRIAGELKKLGLYAGANDDQCRAAFIALRDQLEQQFGASFAEWYEAQLVNDQQLVAEARRSYLQGSE